MPFLFAIELFNLGNIIFNSASRRWALITSVEWFLTLNKKAWDICLLFSTLNKTEELKKRKCKHKSDVNHPCNSNSKKCTEHLRTSSKLEQSYFNMFTSIDISRIFKTVAIVISPGNPQTVKGKFLDKMFVDPKIASMIYNYMTRTYCIVRKGGSTRPLF